KKRAPSVAQTFLSAGSRDIRVPCFPFATDWRLESRQNAQAGKPALQGSKHGHLCMPEPAKANSRTWLSALLDLRWANVSASGLLFLSCALITGCHRQKPAAAPKNVVRGVAVESSDSGKIQARSEY